MNHKSSFYCKAVLCAYVLCGITAFAALLAFLNWFLFIKETKLQNISVPQNSVTFSRAALDGVLSAFDSKRARYNSARVSLPVIADPSK